MRIPNLPIRENMWYDSASNAILEVFSATLTGVAKLALNK